MMKSRIFKKKGKDQFELAALWKKELQKKVELMDSRMPVELHKIWKCGSLESLDLRVRQQQDTGKATSPYTLKTQIQQRKWIRKRIVE